MAVQYRVGICCGLLCWALLGCGSIKSKSAQQDLPQIENALRARVERIVDVNTIVVSANGMEETVHLVGIMKTGYEIPQKECELYKAEQMSGEGHHHADRKAGDDIIAGPGKDLKHLSPEVQTYRSEKAKLFTKQLLQNERVLVLPLDPARDQQKNLRAMVYREADQLYVNYAVIRMGYGQVDQTESFAQLAAFQSAQQTAQQEKLGLWGAPLPENEKQITKSVQPHFLPDDYVVFISEQNRLYHLEHCKKLDETRYPVQVKDARKGKYRPCTICCPGE